MYDEGIERMHKKNIQFNVQLVYSGYMDVGTSSTHLYPLSIDKAPYPV